MRFTRSFSVISFLLVFLVFTNPAFSAVNALKAVKISSLPGNQVNITLRFEQALQAKPNSFALPEANSLVFDFAQTTSGLNPESAKQIVKIGALESFTAVDSGDRTRVILKLNEMVSYQAGVTGNVYTITLSGGTVTAKNFSVERFPPLITKRYLHQINDINFSAKEKCIGKIVVDLSDNKMSADILKTKDKITVTFLNTTMPQSLRRRLDVVEFNTPVSTVDSMVRGTRSVIVIDTREDFEHFVYQVDKKFIIEVKPISKTQSQKESIDLNKRFYKGKKISLNFHTINIRALLQLLAQSSGFNIVVSDTVVGDLTIKLDNVPWDQALDIILRTRGLDKRVFGSVMMIAPIQEIAAQEKQELQAKLEVEQLSPLASELIELKYAKAEDIANLLKDKNNTLLSPRGNVSVDERTNTVWIQDNEDKLVEIRDLVTKLDKAVRQVLIEARVVIVNKDFERDIGVRFGATRPRHLSGTLEGANYLAAGNPVNTIDPENYPLDSRLNVDLPAFIKDSNVATIGLALAKLSNGTLIDLELSALEVEGHGEVISSPRIITANQQAAVIERGEEIPYLEQTSSGATSVAFKKAVLSLSVTPQITPNNKIILALQVNEDTVSNLVVNGVPAINTKHLKTNVLVDNGQTVVLGGIYTQTTSNRIERVPFLGKIPVIGALFGKKNRVEDHEELLIFVTPKVIDKDFNSDYS